VAIKQGEMLLSNRVRAPTKQPLDLLTISCLEGSEHRYIASLQLVGGVRRQTAKGDVVLVTSSDSCCGAKPSLISTRDLPPARALVSGSNTFRIQYNAIVELEYPVSLQA
jgi:hypothetical protein